MDQVLGGREACVGTCDCHPHCGTPLVLMGLFTIEASYYMQTFEVAFYIRFFKYQNNIFGPMVRYLARYVAYQVMEYYTRYVL